MNNNALTMDPRYAVSAKLAECYVTIEGKRILFGQAINMSARMEKEKIEVPILGRINKGHKANGMTGTGSMTFYANTPIFKELAYRYQETGEDIYFDMQVTNEDPTSGLGRQTTILRDCNFDSLDVANFDADGEFLQDEMDFTFERFDFPEKFKALPNQ